MFFDSVRALELLLQLHSGRNRKRHMEELPRDLKFRYKEKLKELSLLRKRKQILLDETAAKEILINDFMVNFIGAVENNHPENAQNFDEKAMMNYIGDIVNNNGEDRVIGGVNGGFSGDPWGDFNVSGIGLEFGEKATTDAILGMLKTIGSRGSSDNCGVAGAQAGINNERDQNPGAPDGTNSKDSDGIGTAGHGGTSDGNRGKNAEEGSF